MRVTHVITRLIIGGAQENTVASVLGLRAKPGLEVRLLSGPTRDPEGSLEPRCAQTPGLLTVVPALVRPMHVWKDVLALAQLTRIFRAQRPDLVHTHSSKAGILGRFAARRARVPVIVHTIHGLSFGSFQGALANRTFRAAERRAARFTTHFVSVADAMTRQALASGIGRPEQFTRIYSGFALEPFLAAKNDALARRRWGLAPNDFVVGKIARLVELKGHDDLFGAAPALVKRCPPMKFLPSAAALGVIGSKPARARSGCKNISCSPAWSPPRTFPDCWASWMRWCTSLAGKAWPAPCPKHSRRRGRSWPMTATAPARFASLARPVCWLRPATSVG